MTRSSSLFPSHHRIIELKQQSDWKSTVHLFHFWRFSVEEQLQELLAALHEFYQPTTAEPRRRELDGFLVAFAQQPEAWRSALSFLANSNDEFMVNYCTTILNNLADRYWEALDASIKQDVRQFVFQYIVDRHPTREYRLQSEGASAIARGSVLPAWLIQSLVKVLVAFEKRDWPQLSPDFIPEVIRLVESPSTAWLGVSFMRAIVETFVVHSDMAPTIPAARVRQLRDLMQQQLPVILATLDSLLATLYAVGTSGSQAESGGATVSVGDFDEDAHRVAVQALECTQLLFNWIPMSYLQTTTLFPSLFGFASLQADGIDGRLGVLAMTCLNELLSRQCFPADVQHFFLALFTHACDQLTLVCETADAEGLADMDSAYLRQCTEFLRLLVIHHSARFVEMDYPIDGLLALLHRFSFALPYGTELKECLNVWAAFCDFLKVQMSNRSANGLRVNALRFQPILMEVLRLILHKTSFTTNAVELRAILEESDEADFSNTNEDEVPLWEDCLRASIELLARIADFFPNEVLEIVFPTILQCFGAFSSTQEMVVQSVEGPRLDQQSARFLEVLPLLQDLPFLLRLFGSLSELFHSHNADSERIFVERFGMAGEFLQNVLQLTAIGATLGVYTQHPVLIDIQANLFAAIRAFADWLATYNVVVIKSNDSNQLAEFEALIGNTTNVLSQCLAPNLPTMVIRNSAQLFLSLARTVRTRALLDAPFTLGLLQAPEEATAFILSLPDVMARTSFVSALVCTLLVTFQEVPEQFQMWSERYARYSSLIQEVYKPLMNAVPYLTSGGDPPLEAVTTVLDSLAMVGGIFNEFNSSVSNATRKVLLTHIEPLLPYVLQLLQACSDSPKIVAAAVQFLEQYYGCARAQVSQELVEQTVLLGGALFTCERLLPVLQSNNASEHETAERYIRILKFIVESSSRISRAALPLILSICMQNLFPALSEAPIIDVHTSFFELLEAAVVWHQGLLASTDFPVIFDMFVWSLSRPDIDLVRRNLALLENMNLKTSLYSTPAFGPLRFIVIDALLRTLTERSLSVLADEIVAAIFEMTRQHFTGFYEEFLPMFVSQCDGLTDEQQSDLVATAGREQDALSFSRNLLSFVQELNFCRRTNAAAALSQ